MRGRDPAGPRALEGGGARRRYPMSLRVAIPDLISPSYFPAIAAVEMGFFEKEGFAATLELLYPVTKTYEIGRASCRGRGEISGGAGSLKKKKKRKNTNESIINRRIRNSKEVAAIIIDKIIYISYLFCSTDNRFSFFYGRRFSKYNWRKLLR